jgi:RNA polymerase sigma-70 factor (ECF subfamily)
LLRRLSDEQLGSRLASGEAAAFDELYRRYVHRLSAYGAHLLGDAASGDDVAQSALLKAYGALRDGRLPDRVKPWLYRIAHNTAIDLVVRRRELPSAELPEGSTGSGEPVERSGALVAALASLPERQRRVYVLRELHGLRIDETGAELGLSASQVEQSLFAARNRLAEHLVFGDRLNCVAVQRLALGPLDGDERRALKTHLRSCSACRSTLGLRGRALSLLPVASLDWLRGLVAGAATGGAPVAAKVGAVVATAAFAAGVPAAVDQASHHPRPLVLPVVVRASAPHHSARTRSTEQTRVVASAVGVLVAARTTVPRMTATVSHRHERGGVSEGSRVSGSDGRHGDSGGDGRDDGSGSDGGQATTVPVVAIGPAATTTATDDSHDGGGGGDHSGSDDGSSGD